MKKYLSILGAVLLSACLLAGGMFLGTQISSPAKSRTLEAAEEPQIATDYTVSPVGSIAIPGYEKLTFQAGERTQYVSLSNPAENDCYFVISILLPDGTELYRSGIIAPGTVIDCLRLNFAPVAGIYENAILRYSCWEDGADGELSEINGANTVFTLEVIP